MQALESTSPLIIYIDIKSPYAFVAIKPILALEARLKTQFDWRPLTLNIPSYLGSAKKSKGKVVKSERTPAQWNNVRYAYRDTRRYAERQGYMLKGTEKIWDINRQYRHFMGHAKRPRRLGRLSGSRIPPVLAARTGH